MKPTKEAPAAERAASRQAGGVRRRVSQDALPTFQYVPESIQQVSSEPGWVVKPRRSRAHADASDGCRTVGVSLPMWGLLHWLLLGWSPWSPAHI
jgi:hypothetical protein